VYWDQKELSLKTMLSWGWDGKGSIWLTNRKIRPSDALSGHVGKWRNALVNTANGDTILHGVTSFPNSYLPYKP
jgi:hypothetical protein